jgi:hypothetical protein
VAKDALDIVRSYGAKATVQRVQKGLVNIRDVDRGAGALLAMGLVAGTLPSNRKAFQAELARATPESKARLVKMAKSIQQYGISRRAEARR